jgi:thiol-disulfide isomerase/thioredoxin
MNKKIVLILSVSILVIIGGLGFVYAKNSSNNKNVETAKNNISEQEVKTEDGPKVAEETMPSTDATKNTGAYVSLADYNANPTKYNDFKKVYFFHAGWCPICQGIDKEINSDISKLPAGVVFVKTDFDSSTDLRKKYGVTTQYTFVQVDGSGNETAQWSASSLSSAIAGIKN